MPHVLNGQIELNLTNQNEIIIYFFALISDERLHGADNLTCY